MPHEDTEAAEGFARTHLASLVHELQSERLRRALSQRRLSALLGLTEIVVGKWEAGADVPSTDSFVRWVRYLGYVADILDRSRQRVTGLPASQPTETPEAYEIRRLATALRMARVEVGFTQRALCGELHVSTQTLLMWETARRQPRVLHLIAWADALGCSLVLTKR